MIVVGPEAGTTYKSKHGYPAVADKTPRQVTVANLDGIIIPGGYAPDRLRRHESIVQLVRQAFDEGKIVAAICHAGWLLCSAGILKGRRATSFMAIRDDMVNAGALWEDQAVVRDGNLITSRTPDDLPVYLRTIIAAAADSSPREATATACTRHTWETSSTNSRVL